MKWYMQMFPKPYDIIDRMFGWWYDTAAPSAAVLEKISPHKREPLRKGRYISLVLLIEITCTLLSYFALLPGPQSATPLLIIALFIGVFLNRIGKTLAAGILVVIVAQLIDLRIDCSTK